MSYSWCIWLGIWCWCTHAWSCIMHCWLKITPPVHFSFLFVSLDIFGTWNGYFIFYHASTCASAGRKKSPFSAKGRRYDLVLLVPPSCTDIVNLVTMCMCMYMALRAWSISLHLSMPLYICFCAGKLISSLSALRGRLVVLGRLGEPCAFWRSCFDIKKKNRALTF